MYLISKLHTLEVSVDVNRFSLQRTRHLEDEILQGREEAKRVS
jgi:hypothetical protein